MGRDKKDKTQDEIHQSEAHQEEKTDDESSKVKSIADGLKRLFTVGSTASFLTEEGIKTALNDIKLPKELLKPLLESAMSSKDQVLHYISKDVAGEITKMMKTAAFQKNIFKLLDTHKLKVSIEIEKKHPSPVKKAKSMSKDKDGDEKVESK